MSHKPTPAMTRLFFKVVGAATGLSIVGAYAYDRYNKYLIRKREDYYLQISKGNTVKTTEYKKGPALVVEIPDVEQHQKNLHDAVDSFIKEKERLEKEKQEAEKKRLAAEQFAKEQAAHSADSVPPTTPDSPAVSQSAPLPPPVKESTPTQSH